MKIKETVSYDDAFPESYHWGSVDNIACVNIAITIRNHIDHDFRTVGRLLIPGLRQALRIIAEYADA